MTAPNVTSLFTVISDSSVKMDWLSYERELSLTPHHSSLNLFLDEAISPLITSELFSQL